MSLERVASAIFSDDETAVDFEHYYEPPLYLSDSGAASSASASDSDAGASQMPSFVPRRSSRSSSGARGRGAGTSRTSSSSISSGSTAHQRGEVTAWSSQQQKQAELLPETQQAGDDGLESAYTVPAAVVSTASRRASERHLFDRWRMGSIGGVREVLSVGLRYFNHGLGVAFAGKFALGLLFNALKRPSRRAGTELLRNTLLDRILNGVPDLFKDSVRFAVTCGLTLGGFRAILMLLRQRRRRSYERSHADMGTAPTQDEMDEVLHNDLHDKILAGAISGMALALDERQRRQSVALFLFVRALDVLRDTLQRRGVIPTWKYTNAALFGICNVPIMYGFLKDPTILPNSYYSWILWMGNLTDADLEHMIRIRDRAVFAGVLTAATPLNTCAGILYPENHAVTGLARDWVEGLGRAARVYAPVHLLPLIIFKHRSLIDRPVETLLRASRSMVMSMAFLTTYQSIVKTTEVVLHEGRLGNTPGAPNWHSCLAGGLTAFACLFESPSRVNELMLYCAPRAMEATYELLVRKGAVKYIQFGEVPLFMVATAIAFSNEPADFKPVYGKLIRFLVGDY